MAERFRNWLLRVLRVPAAPAPPPGNPDVIRTFRAAPNYFRYSIATWVLKQASALTGLLFSYLFFRSLPIPGVHRYVGLIEQLAVLGFLAQLPFSFALLRLNFEMRWYMLSDRSLRIRHGILSVREQTMTFANIQNISIRQNPLQQLFGIATVVVRAAGGGGGSSGSPGASKQSDGSHEATFEGVDNAEQIRSAIRDRIRMHRDAGLGDPEERGEAHTLRPGAASSLAMPLRTSEGSGTLRPAVAAARTVVAEAAALRASFQEQAWRTM